MAKRHDDALLEDINIAAEKIAKSLKGVDVEAFEKNDDKQGMVCYNLSIIGEAAGKLSPELTSSYPNVPWRQIKALRNFLIHAYHGVNMSRVWSTATTDVPKLLSDLKKES